MTISKKLDYKNRLKDKRTLLNYLRESKNIFLFFFKNLLKYQKLLGEGSDVKKIASNHPKDYESLMNLTSNFCDHERHIKI